ncbi:MAG TPA: HAD-IIIA family hydrolase, partial [Candidatus Nanoarchaeia archaeon]|nr:HAD-IIIA family hydrolase [Candidatus Nanoarchaeia archaeon]
PDTPGALRQFKELGYSLIVITNQAVISRGWLTEDGMNALHRQYNKELERLDSVPIDFFYFCPHHPNADTPQYRKVCECRKPGHALITRAAKEHSIDLSQSWMIGDKITDIVAGKNAGCRTILIHTPASYETNVSGKTVDKNIRADYEVGNIAEAVAIVRGARRR